MQAVTPRLLYYTCCVYSVQLRIVFNDFWCLFLNLPQQLLSTYQHRGRPAATLNAVSVRS